LAASTEARRGTIHDIEVPGADEVLEVEGLDNHTEVVDVVARPGMGQDVDDRVGANARRREGGVAPAPLVEPHGSKAESPTVKGDGSLDVGDVDHQMIERHGTNLRHHFTVQCEPVGLGTTVSGGRLMSSYRYPFAPYPTGWYLIAASADLAPGEVKPVTYFGRDLVLFRTDAGQAVVADAHCPHMGAHLGYGGCVDAGGIRCPFHGWHFDADGRCDDVPYTSRAGVPRVGLNCWPVHETSGLILVHYSDHDRPPAWHMPDLAEWGQPGWIGYETVGWTIRMHVQELAENIPDTAHFQVVHGLPVQPEAVVSVDGHIYRQRTITRIEGHEREFSQTAYGLGLVWLRIPGEHPYVFLTATTPIDDERVELRLLFLVDEGPAATELSAGGREAVKAAAENTARDVPIWEHKVYRPRPPLVPGDGPLGMLRTWAAQFYESDDRALTMSEP
jgi:3-ketosteroid 9alpha-monooxygenase subunit A